MIDPVIGAQFAAFCQFRIVASSRDYAAVEEFCNLDGGDADAGTRSQDQHGLSGANAGASNKHVPRCDEDKGHAGGLNEIERIGNWNHAGCGNGDQFAIAAIHAIPQHGKFAALVLQARDTLRTMSAEVHGSDKHALSRFKSADVFSGFDYFARDVAAKNVRQFDSRQSFAHPNVEVIEGTRADAN